MLTPFILFDVKQRITFAEVIENEWFKKGYKPPTFEQADVSLDDVDAIFNESGVTISCLLYLISILITFLFGVLIIFVLM